MEQRAGNFGVLPRSTAHRIVTKQAMPHSLQQFQAYLRACEVPETDRPDWEAAWTRAWRHEKHGEFVLTAKERERAWESARILRERIQQTYGSVAEPDEEAAITRDGSFRDGSFSRYSTVKYVAQPRRAQRRGPGRASRHLPERPVQGQLSFNVAEHVPEPDPGALF
ncbi:hypothetical protein ACFU96_10125 [Streptomyces sp. NPDC057620]|uniref:hypothetical protein n=1 Tax=Streptomyces sp. NPDC057620 TaxID=3346185 RepID=UPI0036CBA668